MSAADREETTDAAAEAFEDLRDEVADLRRAIEQLPKRIRSGKAPDYAATLGTMLQALERIETHPALQITPRRYAAEMVAAVQAARQLFDRDLQEALSSIREASNSIQRSAGGLRTRVAQRKAVIYAAAGGLGAGVVLWATVAGPIARAFPMSWRAPERMAAATLNLDRWAAGSRLMQTADPRAWADLVAAWQLWRDNGKALVACARAVAKTGKPQTCKVTVSPTVLPQPIRAAGAKAPRD